MNTVSSFAPANISCIFRIHLGSTPKMTGSTGVGFTLSDGVTVSVSQSSSTQIFFNKKQVTIAPVLSVIKKLTDKFLLVHITSEFPLGGGFGVSGAASLATAYALNTLLSLQMDSLSLAKIAAVSEVENKTGLGDVINQYFKGFLLKTKPSYLFEVTRIPLSNIPVYCRFISPLSTKAIIQDEQMQKKIDTAGKRALEEIEALVKAKKITFEEIIAISKQFATESGLLVNGEVKEIIRTIEANGGKASMIMLGNAVFSNIPFEHSQKYIIP